jgi:hypothetical protein
MRRSVYERLRYHAAEAGAALIRALPLNHVTLVVTGGRQVYRKRRRWYSPALIACARLSRPRFLVLSGAEWATWERAVYKQLYGEQIHGADQALDLPARPGQPLAQILLGSTDLPRAVGAVATALRALAEIHERAIVMPDGTTRRFSHGDASAANVTFLDRAARAWWFDFETAHPTHLSHAWRCADDMRALIFSSAAILGEGSIAELARLPAAHYPNPPVLAALHGCVLDLLQRPDPLHIAQTRISYGLNRALAQAILRQLVPAHTSTPYSEVQHH